MALHYTASAEQLLLFVCSVFVGSWNWNWIGRDWLIAINFQLRKCLKSWVWVLLWIHYILWLKKKREKKNGKSWVWKASNNAKLPIATARSRKGQRSSPTATQKSRDTHWLNRGRKWQMKKIIILCCCVAMAGETTQFISPNTVSDSDDRERESPSCRWCYWVHVNCA